MNQFEKDNYPQEHVHTLYDIIQSHSKILCQIPIVQREKAHLMRFYSSPAVRGYLSDRDLISIHRTKTAQVRKAIVVQRQSIK